MPGNLIHGGDLPRDISSLGAVAFLGAEGLRRLNEFVVRTAHAEGFVDPPSCVADTTAQEAQDLNDRLQPPRGG
ncbi:MAG: hypothetical protein IPK13_25050 [Deltaproteobacteria bacterium]|nr:hypothetical protein [Deltaproteobacteria bacterium]